jgi:hypothetical protein
MTHGIDIFLSNLNKSTGNTVNDLHKKADEFKLLLIQYLNYHNVNGGFFGGDHQDYHLGGVDVCTKEYITKYMKDIQYTEGKKIAAFNGIGDAKTKTDSLHSTLSKLYKQIQDCHPAKIIDYMIPEPECDDTYYDTEYVFIDKNGECDCDKLKSVIADLEQQVSYLDLQINTLKQTTKKVNGSDKDDEINRLIAEIEKMHIDIHDKIYELSHYKVSDEEKQNEIKVLRNRLEQCLKQVEDLKKKLADTKEDLEQSYHDLDYLRDKLEQLENTNNQVAVEHRYAMEKLKLDIEQTKHDNRLEDQPGVEADKIRELKKNMVLAEAIKKLKECEEKLKECEEKLKECEEELLHAKVNNREIISQYKKLSGIQRIVKKRLKDDLNRLKEEQKACKDSQTYSDDKESEDIDPDDINYADEKEKEENEYDGDAFDKEDEEYKENEYEDIDPDDIKYADEKEKEENEYDDEFDDNDKEKKVELKKNPFIEDFLRPNSFNCYNTLKYDKKEFDKRGYSKSVDKDFNQADVDNIIKLINIGKVSRKNSLKKNLKIIYYSLKCMSNYLEFPLYIRNNKIKNYIPSETNKLVAPLLNTSKHGENNMTKKVIIDIYNTLINNITNLNNPTYNTMNFLDYAKEKNEIDNDIKKYNSDRLMILKYLELYIPYASGKAKPDDNKNDTTGDIPEGHLMKNSVHPTNITGGKSGSINDNQSPYVEDIGDKDNASNYPNIHRETNVRPQNKQLFGCCVKFIMWAVMIMILMALLYLLYVSYSTSDIYWSNYQYQNPIYTTW